MSLLCIDQEKCTNCGLCCKVCPNILEQGESRPTAKYPELCIGCGQCTAVCPQAALDNTHAPLANQVPINPQLRLTPDAAAQFLRTRRSIRHYQQKPVPHAALEELLNIARFAPTAGNGQGISYIIVENKALLKQVVALTVEWMKQQSLDETTTVAKSFRKHIELYTTKGLDTILRDAPHQLLAVAPKGMPRGRENTIFSLAYLELYAPSLGLGSCWAGLLEMCLFAGYQPVLDLLMLPPDKEVTGAVMIGYPLYRYQRMVDRNPLELTWR